MSNTYWTLKHLENLGGKLSTDGKSFTLGENTYPCRLKKVENQAIVVFNEKVMNTPKQQPDQKAELDQAAQPCLQMYITAEAIPACFLPLFKESSFVNIGTKRYLRLRTRVHHTGIIVDKIL